MQDAETVLNVIRERGRRALPLERLYRHLFNRQLFLIAYGRIYANAGSMTPGVTPETVDGMSLEKIDGIIGRIRSETYRWKPVRRVEIPKPNGRTRPLGVPTWSDKLVAEVVRLLLDAYYDAQFSDRSHGFRASRGCHTALSEVAHKWTGTSWFIEGDLADFFGSLDHEIMLSTLAEKIHDGRFLQLLKRMLKAGYLADWRLHPTHSGAPQGGPVSPLLSNIYLDRFDQFVEKELIPEYTRGARRARHRPYEKLRGELQKARRAHDVDRIRELKREMRTMPGVDPDDPDYRRLRYVRYADDFLLGFSGPKREAEEIKARIGEFLRDELRLELSEQKTLITHASSQAARFLGYEVRAQRADCKISGGRRATNGKIGLYVPRDVIRKRCASYMRKGKPAELGLRIHDSDFSIVGNYGAELRGVIQYYLMAQNVGALSRLQWVMECSMLRTLASKHSSTTTKMSRKYKRTIATPYGERRCFMVEVPRDGKPPLMAKFGETPLRRQRTVSAEDRIHRAHPGRTELVKRLLARECEVCGAGYGLQVHHVRKLADLNQPGRKEKSFWIELMATRRRKTLVVCVSCHNKIHGHGTGSSRNGSLESRVR
ncbi:reverse transcriptase domain-containing protein [Kitasatospora sp. NPDC059327]|uniref:reverse transcriptase/maturase family protein n=1 Tax=Kitasatospora sp. NPDC059327 TaxID=3346803 RepID=UPI0036D010B0